MGICYLAIDCGTSGVKCLLLDDEGGIIGFARNEWSYVTPPEIPFAVEFDPKLFWEKTCKTVKEALRNGKVSKNDVAAISTTSQRDGVVFLDAKGDEVYGGPNIDARGFLAQDQIIDKFGTDIYRITGKWPPLLFAAARLLWFQENQPNVYRKINQILPFNNWIVFKLSGIYASTPSSAAETSLFDLKRMEWAWNIIEELEFPKDIFPTVHEAGEAIGEIDREAATICELKAGTPVVLASGDTQCGLLGMQAIKPGQVGIVSGMTTPLQLVTSEPLIDSEMRTWTGCHVVPKMWVAESNAGMTGEVITWFIDKILSIPRDADESYKELDRLASRTPPCSEETLTFAGPEIMDVKNITQLKPNIILFPRPVGPATKPIGVGELARSNLENIAFAIKGNYIQLEDIYGEKIQDVRITGGMCRLKTFLQIVADVLGLPIKTTRIRNGSALGCAICAAVGSRKYATFEKAAKSLIRWKTSINPDEKRAKIYRTCFERWISVYNRLNELEE
ncbi:MAG: FGGY-family carbohydrate kinase [Promethearchaeota archaeon]